MYDRRNSRLKHSIVTATGDQARKTLAGEHVEYKIIPRFVQTLEPRINIFYNIFMPTTVHIPKPLLEAVDQKAGEMKISRNRFIVTVLERELAHEVGWTPGFFDRLRAVPLETVKAVDEMLLDIQTRRSSKPPPEL